MTDDGPPTDATDGPAWPYSVVRDGGPPRRPLSITLYWLPGIAFGALLFGIAAAAAALAEEPGWTAFAIPCALGVTAGYGLPLGRYKGSTVMFVVGACPLLGAAILAVATGPLGAIFGMLFGALDVLPTLLCMALGARLRRPVRRMRWYHARYLP